MPLTPLSTTRPDRIEKDPRRLRVPPNLPRGALADDEARARYRFDDVQRALLFAGADHGMNLGWLCSDRHVDDGRGDDVAVRFVSRAARPATPRSPNAPATTTTTTTTAPTSTTAADLTVTTATWSALAVDGNRFAHVLRALDVAPGARVFSLLGRGRALLAAALGTWKARAVFAPVFQAFGPEPLATRVALGDGRVLVTTPSHYAKKVAPVRARLPSLRHVLLVPDAGRDAVFAADVAAIDGGVDLLAAMAAQPARFDVERTAVDELALLHFTSGTTGRPKGALHVHGAAAVHALTGRLVLDLHDDDVFWCTADPGWVTGMSYGVIAPLVLGVTSVVDEGEFDAERWYRVLAGQRVSVWYTAPTAVRMLMRAGRALRERFDLSALRFAGSVGEPLPPEAVWWSLDVLGVPLHDNWWQTETGGIMIANVAADDLRPGAMGRPVPGIVAGLVHRRTGPDGFVHVDVVDEPDVTGELALRPGWPSMFRGYLHDDERTRACFVDDWYLTGDLARRDAEGLYWFVGRTDDVIKTSGHLIGPFEVESALMEHEAVAEAAVVGLPDDTAGQVLKAFVVPKSGREPRDDDAREELRLSVLGFARQRLGPVVAPKDIAFVTDLPRTRSGKILRRLLRARELGLPEGDTSTLEGGAP
jgi:acetyl-CoA synthetase